MTRPSKSSKEERGLPEPMEEVLPRVLQALVIIAAGWWIYQPVLHGDWLWDDTFDTKNPITRSATGLWNIWFEPGSQLDYYPVKASVQWVQWHLWGNDTFGYHLTNVVLHLVNALLVWRLLAKLGVRRAWLGGLLFAIHPAMVESVAWIAELKNTLSMAPFLLAMIFYLDFDEHGRWRDYLPALGLFLVAMLTKPTMVMFPVVILLCAWWKRGRIGGNDLKASAPFFVISLVVGLITLSVGTWYRQHHAAPDFVVPVGGFFSRLALAGLSVSFYFSNAVWPVGLLPIYTQWPVNPPSLMQFLPWPVLGGIIYGLWVNRRGWGRHALLGLGFFLIMLAPFVSMNVGGYATFTWVMDHFLYIPIVGLIGLAVAGLGAIEERLSSGLRSGCGAMVAAVMALLAWMSHDYAEKFINQEALWTYTLQVNPDAWPARNNLGNALLDKGRVSDAIEQFGEVLRLKPEYADAHTNLGFALVQAGRIPEGIRQYQEALRMNANSPELQKNWGNALVRAGQSSEAVAHYQEALRLDPTDAEAHNNWANVLFLTGHLPEALAHYQEAVRLNPAYVDAHNNWGYVLVRMGHTSEAIEQFQEALRLDPNNAMAYASLAKLQTTATPSPLK